ncbi:MAG: type II toxin-antitoxin system PemK/MazF family toxin [Gaiella sp.]|nr:type II toxin-antitoxin system PemK/MazF family toxin [Gaiella sp.]
MSRGDVYDAALPGGSHPAVIVTRDRAIPLLRNVCVVAVTSRVRNLATEVPLGTENGLARDCVANCDNLFTIPKQALDRRRGTLGPDQARRLNEALRIALELD